MPARQLFENRRLLVLTVLVISVAGISALNSIPRAEDPRVVNRFPVVVVRAPGMSAAQVEALVTSPIEVALQETDEIKHIHSTSRTGFAAIVVELLDTVTYANVQGVYSEIRDRLGTVQLPAGVEPPSLDDNRRPACTRIAALRWGDERPVQFGVLNRLAEDLADRLRGLSGTELVRLYGNTDEEFSVNVDPLRLAELGLTVLDLSRMTQAADARQSAGVVRTPAANVLLEVEGELDSMERIVRIPIRQGDAQSIVRLGDVATTRKSWREPVSEIGIVDGDRCIYVAARMREGDSVDDWSVQAGRIIQDFERAVGPAVHVDSIFDQREYTSDRLTNLGNNLFISALVVLAVVFVLMGWRQALTVGLSLPLVLALVLFTMFCRGHAMHQVSVVGMILAIGLLIDNAIVVSDEVAGNLAGGRDRLSAVSEAVRHLFPPLLASTLTTVLAFAPILLLPGGVGDVVRAMGESVILALLYSLLIALTLTAALAGMLVCPEYPATPRRWWVNGLSSPRLLRASQAGLRFAVAFPVAALLLAAFLPCSGFLVARSLGREFFPPADRDMFHVQVWLPAGTSIESSERQAENIDHVIHEHLDSGRVYWLIGGSFPTLYYNMIMNQDEAAHYSQAIVTAGSHAEVSRAIPPLQEALDERFPAAQIVVRQFGQGPPLISDIEYRIVGRDVETLQQIGEELRLVLQQHPDVLHTQMTIPRGTPKLWFAADEEESRIAGFSLTELASQMQMALEGRTSGVVLEDLQHVPVRIRYGREHRRELARIASMPLVQIESGSWAPLLALGRFQLRPELNETTRYDAERCNVVRAFTRHGALPLDVTVDITAALEARGFQLPPGYRIVPGGAVEQDRNTMRNLFVYVPVLVAIALAALILVFRSVVLAMVLCLVAALSVGLGLLSTCSMGFPISITTVLGILGLIGVALNDSIVVLAAIRSNPDARRGDGEAVVAEVVGCTRHVLATTATTLGGFLPLVLFVDGQFWPSLAIVMAAGILGATLLALLLIPAAYVLLQRILPGFRIQ